MHIDENKKFDRRNLNRNLKDGVITQKDLEVYLAKLPDVSDKIFNPEETSIDSEGLQETRNIEAPSRRKGARKKPKTKGK
jgi:hypothetical protein